MSITATTVREWIRAYADEIAAHRAELVKLDTAIGDGDHGTNMDRGMRKAVENHRVDTVVLVAHQRLAGQLQQDTAIGELGHGDLGAGG